MEKTGELLSNLYLSLGGKGSGLVSYGTHTIDLSDSHAVSVLLTKLFNQISLEPS